MKKLILVLLSIPLLAMAVTANKVWRIPVAGSLGAWGPVNLADSTNAVTGRLPTLNVVQNPDFSDSTQVKTGGLPSVLSTDPGSSRSLKIVRAQVSSPGTSVSEGEGVVCTGGAPCKTGTGTYLIPFSVAFSAAPVCTFTAVSNSFRMIASAGGSTGNIGIKVFDDTATLADSAFDLICTGPK